MSWKRYLTGLLLLSVGSAVASEVPTWSAGLVWGVFAAVGLTVLQVRTPYDAA